MATAHAAGRIAMKHWQSRLHEIAFGTGIGERTQSLLRGMSWTLPIAMASRVVCGIATMLAARWMGPAEYGKANLVLAVTFWIQIPLFLGLPTALLHFVPQAKQGEKGRWIRDGMWLQGAAGGVTLLAAIVFRTAWAGYAGVPEHIFDLAVIWCCCFFLYTVATTLFAAQENFRARSLSDLGFAIIFPVAVLGIGLAHALSGTRYVLALSFGYAGIGIAALFRAWFPLETAGAPVARWRPLLSYGLTASIGGVVSALFNSPARLVMNRELGFREVGLLSAYQAGSIQMAFFMVAALAPVFFPIASRTPDKQKLLIKLIRIMAFGSILSIPAYSALLAVYFAVLGKSYTLQLPEMFVFSAAACLTMGHGVLAWFLSSQGVRGTFTGSMIGILAGFINYAGCLYWIPEMKVLGAGLAYGTASAVGIAGCYLYMRALKSPSTLENETP